MCDWFVFLANLGESDARWGCPSSSYTHVPSGTVYTVARRRLGKGCYGRVYAYRGAPEDSRLPSAFCVKVIAKWARQELAAMEARPGGDDGIVEARVLRSAEFRGGVYADVAMRQYQSTIVELTMGSCGSALARSLTVRVSELVQNLWHKGLAYCDIKCANVLWDDGCVVLGDVGAAVPRGAVGMITFPPQRCVSGIVCPSEADLVWGLCVLLMSLVFGSNWTNDRYSHVALKGASPSTFVNLCGDAILRAAALAAGDEADAACGRAILYAVRAWQTNDASIGEFMQSFDEKPAPETPPQTKRLKTR